MKNTVFATFLAILMLVNVPAYAKGESCYTPAEAEADQGIRIHSELMVIGLNCQHLGKRFGKDFYGDYRRFTLKYADIFGGYETILMDYFKKNGAASPVAKLNDLRTRYANKISNDAADMRPDIFCSKFAPRIEAAKGMTEKQIHEWAATIYPNHPVSHPICKS